MQRWRTVAAAVAVCVGGAGIARAAPLLASVRESATADQQKLAIDTYVKAQIERIVKHDKGAAAAREELGSQPEAGQTVTPSAIFQKTYVDSVLANLGPLMVDKTDKGVLPRLNAAIVVARLCKSTHLSQLTPVTEQLMQDQSSAVTLWGLKGAAEMLPGELSLEMMRKKQTLTTAIVAAAKSHPEAGVVVQTAYDALYLPDQQTPIDPKAFVPCIDAMNTLLALRVQQYVAGLPASPQAERVPPVFFVRQTVASVTTSQQQFMAVQNMVNLLSAAVQHTAALPAGDTGVQIVELVKNYAGGLNILLRDQKAVADKFLPLTRIRPPLQTSALEKDVADAVAAVRTLPNFSALKDPPTINPPTSQPAP